MSTKSLPERMQAFYEQLNVDHEAALRQLPELYTQDVQFVSPIEERDGIHAFQGSWEAAFKTYKAFTFTDFKCIGDDESFALFYTMTIEIAVGNPMPTPTATLFIAREGKVYYQYDYWDTVGGLSQIYPPLHTAYEWAVALFLGGGKPLERDPGVQVPMLGKDGCYHPQSEAEVVSLVRKAHALGGKVRAVGSGHSVWEAIIPEGFDPDADTNERLMMLDRMNRVLGFRPDPKDPSVTLVEVEAGCALGESPRHPIANPLSPTASRDPRTPNVTRNTDWEHSLNYTLDQRGLALPDLGGITHQAVGGFLSTGSAGGTCKWSFLDAIVALRVVDGQGNVRTLTADGPDPDAFASVGAGIGLLGVVVSVTLRTVPRYNIVGRETVSLATGAPDLDFYGAGDAQRPSLAGFLKQTDYARLMWWPQRNFDRLVVWQAARVAPTPDFVPKPYEEVGSWSVIKQTAASLLYTVLGNIDDPSRIADQVQRMEQLGHDFGAAARALVEAIRSAPPPDPSFPVVPQEEHPWLASLAEAVLGNRHPAITLGSAWVRVAEVLAHMLDTLVAGALSSELFQPLAKLLGWAAPHLIDTILSPFVALGKDGAPATQHFQDSWYLGLPMDNGMDDLLMPTYFTEIWIPFTEAGGEVQQAIAALRKLFDADGTAEGCYAATGPFSIELYATKAGQTFFLDPAYGDKDVFRVDVFWFGYNGGSPVDEFYPRFWKALEGLEYRLHWGKFLPRPDQLAPATLMARYPKWDAWRAARERMDPGNVFLTDYWKTHLGL
ncbi:MAG: FAD-binding protein [Sandaracinaceae bacterium]|nr:FAD-binding protein [Sandaracinaceae bacterium]